VSFWRTIRLSGILNKTVVVSSIVGLIALVSGIIIGMQVSSTNGSGTGSLTATSSSVNCTLSSSTYGVIILVVQNNFSSGSSAVRPVAGAIITGNNAYDCGNERIVNKLSRVVTNSSGSASLLDGGIGLYYLNIYDGGSFNYTISIPTRLVSVTFVTYNITTGNVTSVFCNYDEAC